ncbi:MAG: hypothetical protein WCO00_14965 [Rhodospirillaceae bacterium]
MKHPPSARLPGVERPEPGLPDVNRIALMRIGAAFLLSFLMASTAPAGLMLPFFNSMLFFWAVVASFVAAASGERLFAPWLTRWDEAAACALGTMVSGWFIDPAAVQRAVEAMRLGG